MVFWEVDWCLLLQAVQSSIRRLLWLLQTTSPLPLHLLSSRSLCLTTPTDRHWHNSSKVPHKANTFHSMWIEIVRLWFTVLLSASGFQFKLPSEGANNSRGSPASSQCPAGHEGCMGCTSEEGTVRSAISSISWFLSNIYVLVFNSWLLRQ